MSCRGAWRPAPCGTQDDRGDRGSYEEFPIGGASRLQGRVADGEDGLAGGRLDPGEEGARGAGGIGRGDGDDEGAEFGGLAFGGEQGQGAHKVGQLRADEVAEAASVLGHQLAQGSDAAQAGGVDGVTRSYLLDLEELIQLAEARLTRELTADECERYLHVSRCPTK